MKVKELCKAKARSVSNCRPRASPQIICCDEAANFQTAAKRRDSSVFSVSSSLTLDSVSSKRSTQTETKQRSRANRIEDYLGIKKRAYPVARPEPQPPSYTRQSPKARRDSKTRDDERDTNATRVESLSDVSEDVSKFFVHLQQTWFYFFLLVFKFVKRKINFLGVSGVGLINLSTGLLITGLYYLAWPFMVLGSWITYSIRKAVDGLNTSANDRHKAIGCDGRAGRGHRLYVDADAVMADIKRTRLNELHDDQVKNHEGNGLAAVHTDAALQQHTRGAMRELAERLNGLFDVISYSERSNRTISDAPAGIDDKPPFREAYGGYHSILDLVKQDAIVDRDSGPNRVVVISARNGLPPADSSCIEFVDINIYREDAELSRAIDYLRQFVKEKLGYCALEAIAVDFSSN